MFRVRFWVRLNTVTSEPFYFLVVGLFVIKNSASFSFTFECKGVKAGYSGLYFVRAWWGRLRSGICLRSFSIQCSHGRQIHRPGFFVLALSKHLLFQVTEQCRNSSPGISACESFFFMGVCDPHGKPKDSLDITKHVPWGLELSGNTRHGRLNLAYLCEGRTVGILYDFNNRIHKATMASTQRSFYLVNALAICAFFLH